MDIDGLIKCARFHRFRLEIDDAGHRELILAVHPTDARDLEVGDRFPVIDNSETFER
jgi:hypothetical protein